jgi:BioD-like phosphotransacetylase family protein
VHTFPAHAHLQALFQAAKLALVPMMLVDRTVPATATRVRQVPPDAPLEEALASWKKREAPS